MNHRMDQLKAAMEIFKAGVGSVLPKNLIRNHIVLKENILSCRDVHMDLADYQHIFLVGFGKASAEMAQTMELILENRITGGHILTKYGHSVPLRFVSVSEAGHPVPDQNGTEGTVKIMEIVRKATVNDLVIVLISGGGSALLTDLPAGIGLEDLSKVNSQLINSGADIREINAVRKHISHLKGGQLVRLASPAAVLSLILSDVVGDRLEVIASGPTVADSSTFEDALQVLEKYHLESTIPKPVSEYLRLGKSGLLPETVKENDPCLHRTMNLLLGNNLTALIESQKKAEEFGYEATIVSHVIDGDVSDVANFIMVQTMNAARGTGKRKKALLFGGEPTVRNTGHGKGGRNQHLALLIAQKLSGTQGIVFLSAGTDGSDGPTDAAGAVCDGTTVEKAKKMNLDAQEYLQNFDSYHFFDAMNGLIKTGPTCTNVMDLMIVLIDGRLLSM